MTAVADVDLANVNVDAGDRAVVGTGGRGNRVAHGHPLAVDALEDGLHGLGVRVQVAVTAAQPEPADFREVPLAVPDAHILRDRHAVAAA